MFISPMSILFFLQTGGPLLIEGENGPEEDLLVGVVSWGEFTYCSAVALLNGHC